jgi:hypothetical protein
MWHSAQRAGIFRKCVCSSLAVGRQRVHDSSAETNSEELLIAGPTDISTATIDCGGYKKKGDSFILLFYLIV